MIVWHKKQRSVLICIGTRPEAIKMLPVVLQMQESRHFKPVILTTGQHQEMVQEVLDLAGLSVSVCIQDTHKVNGNLNGLSGHLISCFEQTIDDLEQPICVLVHGDTTSSLSCALAAFHLRIPVVHIEAGLRSGDSQNPFPEEMNRQLISSLSCFHLAPTYQNAQNLIREQVDTQTIMVTGNTTIDALLWARTLPVEFDDIKLQQICDQAGRIITVTVHRRENWNGGITRIAQTIARLAKMYPQDQWVAPLHPNPRVYEQFAPYVQDIDNVHVSKAMDFAQFAKLIDRSYMIITDSGGIQEEAPALDKPVLVTRDCTERHEAVEAGTVKLVGSDPEIITAATQRLMDDPNNYNSMALAVNPYGDGKAADHVLQALEHVFADGPQPQVYGARVKRQHVNSQASLSPQLAYQG